MRLIDLPTSLSLENGVEVTSIAELSELIKAGTLSNQILKELYNGNLVTWLRRLGKLQMAEAVANVRTLAELAERIIFVPNEAQTSECMKLAPGIHRLEEPLEIAKSLVIEGGGREVTRIIGAFTEADCVIRFIGQGTLTIRGVTIEYQGQAPADVLQVTDGYAQIEACKVAGAKYHRQVGWGNGIHFKGRSRGRVEGCECTGNEACGILVSDQANITITNNNCSQNGFYGIAVFNEGTGTIAGNTCTCNNVCGIWVDNSASKLLWQR